MRRARYTPKEGRGIRWATDSPKGGQGVKSRKCLPRQWPQFLHILPGMHPPEIERILDAVGYSGNHMQKQTKRTPHADSFHSAIRPFVLYTPTASDEDN